MLLLVRHLLLEARHLFLVASLLLVAMPGAPSSAEVHGDSEVHDGALFCFIQGDVELLISVVDPCGAKDLNLRALLAFDPCMVL